MKKIIYLSITFSILFLTSAFSVCVFAQNAGYSASNNVYIVGGYVMRNIDFISFELPNGAIAKKKITLDSFDITVGYRFNGHFKADIEYFSTGKAVLAEAEGNDGKYYYRSSAIFANIVYDFLDLYKYKVSPFLGAGAGIIMPVIEYYELGEKKTTWITNGFSYKFQGGISFLLFDFMSLTLKYSYMSIPTMQSISETAPSNNFEGNSHSVGASISFLI